MKKVFSITMTILFLLVSFRQELVVVYFKLNQQDIEKEFCKNKAKPELQCHGKCHLKKELEKSEKNDLELSSIFKKIDILPNQNFEFPSRILKMISNKVFCYREFGHFEPYLEIFVPPPIV